jgi:hypothetical protein
MGAGESKPVFPTDKQWNEWKTERDRKIDETIKKAECVNAEQLSKDVIATLHLFEKYMQACHDKSKLKLLFSDNNECTLARNNFVQHVALTASHAITADQVVSELRSARRRT